MKGFYKKIISTALAVLLLIFFILYPSATSALTKRGLLLWFEKVIPSLLPMMLLSDCMISMNLTASFSALLHPILTKLFSTSLNGSYCIIMGFLCGFPMGARIIARLLREGTLTSTEAKCLLPFCNNVGPVFFLSYVVPVLNLPDKWMLFFLFYSVPLVYGYILCLKLRRHKVKNHIQIENPLPFYEALEHAITESAAGCLKLGGYIVIFQILFLIPVIFLQEGTPVFAILSSLFEITAGLTFFHDLHPFIWSQVLAISLPLALLQFGGLSFYFRHLVLSKAPGFPYEAI